MPSNISKGSRAAWAWGFMALWGVLAMGLCALASRAEAAPFAYVANGDVIDTATNTVVATIPVVAPTAVAVAPDGKHVYFANSFPHTVSVIDTATTLVATVLVGNGFRNDGGIAITPDGKHAYVTNAGSNDVSVIATVTNTVVASRGGEFPLWGRHHAR